MGENLNKLLDMLTKAARKIGRFTAKQLLCLYYVLKDGVLSKSDRAWVYAALIYVLVPGDLIPRRVFHLLGITDDAVAIVYVINKVRDKITPEILQKVEMQLDEWFGYEVTEVEKID